MNLLKVFILIFLFYCNSILADGYIGLVGVRNEGEHIFETGNKYPNLSGIRGGSRITYQRNFNLGGIEGGYFKTNFPYEVNSLRVVGIKTPAEQEMKTFS